MKKHPLVETSSDALVLRFEDLCLLQYRSLEREEIAAYNRRLDEIESIVDELMSRPGDERRLLQRFYNHKNAQVALTAAHANLAIDYVRARKVFEEIAEDAMGIQQLEAGMTLDNLDRGIYLPK